MKNIKKYKEFINDNFGEAYANEWEKYYKSVRHKCTPAYSVIDFLKDKLGDGFSISPMEDRDDYAEGEPIFCIDYMYTKLRQENVPIAKSLELLSRMNDAEIGTESINRDDYIVDCIKKGETPEEVIDKLLRYKDFRRAAYVDEETANRILFALSDEPRAWLSSPPFDGSFYFGYTPENCSPTVFCAERMASIVMVSEGHYKDTLPNKEMPDMNLDDMEGYTAEKGMAEIKELLDRSEELYQFCEGIANWYSREWFVREGWDEKFFNNGHIEGPDGLLAQVLTHPEFPYSFIEVRKGNEKLRNIYFAQSCTNSAVEVKEFLELHTISSST